jgi:adenylylsulfate kinase
MGRNRWKSLPARSGGPTPFSHANGTGAVPATAPGRSEGWVVWIEGLPCSGKTTLARSTGERLGALGQPFEVLDGDEVRRLFSPELGFSRKDREMHARRVSYVARMLARHGVYVLVAMITPYETSRQAARGTVGERFSEVWLKCPIEVCRSRDSKGLYRRPAGGAGARVTGVDDPFEEPLAPELVLDTAADSAAVCTDKLLHYLSGRALPAVAR